MANCVPPTLIKLNCVDINYCPILGFDDVNRRFGHLLTITAIMLFIVDSNITFIFKNSSWFHFIFCHLVIICYHHFVIINLCPYVMYEYLYFITVSHSFRRII